jgi:hypothetical protein
VKRLSVETSQIYAQGNSQQQVVEVGYTIDHDTTLRVMLSSAIKESMSAMQRSGESGQLGSDSGVR